MQREYEIYLHIFFSHSELNEFKQQIYIRKNVIPMFIFVL